MLFTVCGPQVCPVIDTFIYYKQLKCPTFFKEPWSRRVPSAPLTSNESMSKASKVNLFTIQIFKQIIKTSKAVKVADESKSRNKGNFLVPGLPQHILIVFIVNAFCFYALIVSWLAGTKLNAYCVCMVYLSSAR